MLEVLRDARAPWEITGSGHLSASRTRQPSWPPGGVPRRRAPPAAHRPAAEGPGREPSGWRTCGPWPGRSTSRPPRGAGTCRRHGARVPTARRRPARPRRRDGRGRIAGPGRREGSLRPGCRAVTRPVFVVVGHGRPRLVHPTVADVRVPDADPSTSSRASTEATTFSRREPRPGLPRARTPAARTPLTLSQRKASAVSSSRVPEVLVPGSCFMTIGSRKVKAGTGALEARTPAVWISGRHRLATAGSNRGAPKVGWCWAGNLPYLARVRLGGRAGRRRLIRRTLRAPALTVASRRAPATGCPSWRRRARRPASWSRRRGRPSRRSGTWIRAARGPRGPGWST